VNQRGLRRRSPDAFDRVLVTEIPADDSHALETKVGSAARMMRDRDAWLKPHQRSAILRRTAGLLEGSPTVQGQSLERAVRSMSNLTQLLLRHGSFDGYEDIRADNACVDAIVGDDMQVEGTRAPP
jgi:hypothetical protein